ncbi:zinc finger protein 414 [Dunckerocampus dactyliophorus]|uniref:zinc finger protein 414 n=1 Tax=Dunckerocampus dactyliophorus TaxID=161453 RepID=UPI002407565D|nr:zinc finger protein 414 [Dunckerocampus dactyliophorus]
MSHIQADAENGIKGNSMMCPLHGCKRVYTDVSALESHVRDHAVPAQSLNGKVFHCSTTGCSCSFPNMQKLMEHIRHHHKPNLFFMCENCRTKLRSYRGLLSHLHTCSKVPRGKMKSTEQTSLQAGPNMATSAAHPNPPQLEAVSTPHQLTAAHVPNPDSSLADTTSPPVLVPQCSLGQETFRVGSGLGEEPRSTSHPAKANQ